MKRRLFGLVLAIGFGLALMACGGSSTPPPTPAAVAPSAPSPATSPEPAASEAASTATLIADFKSVDRFNALGGEFGAWASDNPVSVSEEEVVGGQGTAGTGAWRLRYDISTPGSYCGAWMRLQGFNASQAKQLAIALRGDGDFTRDMIVELKVGREGAVTVGRYILRGITNQFQTFTIPLNQFAGLTTFSPLYELTFVFDEQTCPVRKGTILIDRITIE
jgi:hypothetical protein